MAKAKDRLNLESLLRVRKVSLSDFVSSQKGETIEEKVANVVNTFQTTQEQLTKLASLAITEKEEVKQAEDTKKVRKKKGADEEAFVNDSVDTFETKSDED